MQARVKRVILVPYDQLSLTKGVMRGADPSADHILMIASERMLASRTWHAQRLHLLLSAAAHHADDLRSRGFTVHELMAPTLAAGLQASLTDHPGVSVHATEPRSRSLHAALTRAAVVLVPDDSFLTARQEFATWSAKRLPVMEAFYRRQRTRLDILMDGDQPVGGQWNFDADNRLPPPKQHTWPEPLTHEPDELDRKVWQDIQARGLSVIGAPPDGTWATTRAGALRQLDHFLATGLAGFGPYEDAMPDDSWSVQHSLLSPYLNLGLLDPAEVIAAALARYEQGGVPISSIEGFVRQLVGWREFVNGVYWATDDDYQQRNELAADQPLPAAFNDPSTTSMQCVRSTVADVHRRGWVHHIPRLMILANLALIVGVRPQLLLDWMRRMFVDAADWVMVPNVIGMGVHADGGAMMTKPYAAGGSYINRMSRHCKSCPFDPKKRTGPDACPMTTLYWDFLARNADAFARNPRMAAQVSSARKLADLREVRQRAIELRAGLAAGTL
jgi:deoxyribodipyrimidine photolyase-related protein